MLGVLCPSTHVTWNVSCLIKLLFFDNQGCRCAFSLSMTGVDGNVAKRLAVRRAEAVPDAADEEAAPDAAATEAAPDAAAEEAAPDAVAAEAAPDAVVSARAYMVTFECEAVQGSRSPETTSTFLAPLRVSSRPRAVVGDKNNPLPGAWTSAATLAATSTASSSLWAANWAATSPATSSFWAANWAANWATSSFLSSRNEFCNSPEVICQQCFTEAGRLALVTAEHSEGAVTRSNLRACRGLNSSVLQDRQQDSVLHVVLAVNREFNQAVSRFHEFFCSAVARNLSSCLTELDRVRLCRWAGSHARQRLGGAAERQTQQLCEVQ